MEPESSTNWYATDTDQSGQRLVETAAAAMKYVTENERGLGFIFANYCPFSPLSFSYS